MNDRNNKFLPNPSSHCHVFHLFSNDLIFRLCPSHVYRQLIEEDIRMCTYTVKKSLFQMTKMKDLLTKKQMNVNLQTPRSKLLTVKSRIGTKFKRSNLSFCPKKTSTMVPFRVSKKLMNLQAVVQSHLRNMMSSCQVLTMIT